MRVKGEGERRYASRFAEKDERGTVETRACTAVSLVCTALESREPFTSTPAALESRELPTALEKQGPFTFTPPRSHSHQPAGRRPREWLAFTFTPWLAVRRCGGWCSK